MALLALALLASLAPSDPGTSRILFVRGGPGTGGFLSGGSDGHLSDINDFSESGGNHGWGTLAQQLAADGFVCEQLVEGPVSNNTPVDFAALDLTRYDVVVLGSNNADYTTAQVDAIEAFVQAGGGLLAISDANWGQNWGDAPTSDQAFLDRFGLTMNQDTGTYTLFRSSGDFVIGGIDQGGHPILAGPDGAVGTADDVDEFDGEGVSPLTLTPGTTGLAPVVLAKAKNTIRINDSFGAGSTRPATVDDGALVVVEVGLGRVAGHFDRNTFFNLNGAGTSIHRKDNRQYARNLFTWLAGGANQATVGEPFCAGDGSATACPCGGLGSPGSGCPNSATANGCRLSASGSTSVLADDLVLRALDATPNVPGLFFQGLGAENGGAGAPFGDGLRCAGGQVVRLDLAFTDAQGCAASASGIASSGGATAGDVRRYQYWYRDVGDEPTPCAAGQGSGFNLSNGLEVTWTP